MAPQKGGPAAGGGLALCTWDRVSEVPAAPAGPCCLGRWHLTKDVEKLRGAQPEGRGRGAEKAAPGDAQGSPHQGCLDASWQSLHSLLASLGHQDPTLGLDTDPCHLRPAPMSASRPGVALQICVTLGKLLKLCLSFPTCKMHYSSHSLKE